MHPQTRDKRAKDYFLEFLSDEEREWVPKGYLPIARMAINPMNHRCGSDYRCAPQSVLFLNFKSSDVGVRKQLCHMWGFCLEHKSFWRYNLWVPFSPLSPYANDNYAYSKWDVALAIYLAMKEYPEFWEGYACSTPRPQPDHISELMKWK